MQKIRGTLCRPQARRLTEGKKEEHRNIDGKRGDKINEHGWQRGGKAVKNASQKNGHPPHRHKPRCGERRTVCGREPGNQKKK